MTNAPLAHWPAGLPFTLTPPQGSMVMNLEVSALRYPDKPAVVFFGRAISYRGRFAACSAATGCCCRCRTVRSL